MKLDVDFERGMGVSIGRLREDTVYDYKFVGLSHNTLRGAAGGAVLCAELLTARVTFRQNKVELAVTVQSAAVRQGTGLLQSIGTTGSGGGIMPYIKESFGSMPDGKTVYRYTLKTGTG